MAGPVLQSARALSCAAIFHIVDLIRKSTAVEGPQPKPMATLNFLNQFARLIGGTARINGFRTGNRRQFFGRVTPGWPSPGQPVEPGVVG
jgi:hypothetical protein